MNAFWQTLLGGLLALAGAAIAPFFQRQHEKWIATRQDQALLRQKSEEVYAEIDVVVQKSQLATLHALQSINSASAEPLLPVADLGKLRGLVSTYFPNSLPILGLFENKETEIAEMIREIMKDSSRTDEWRATMKTLPAIVTSTHQEAITTLASSLRAHMVDEMSQHPFSLK